MIEKVATAIAAAGFVASAVVHAMALFGGPAPPVYVAYALFAGGGLSQVLAMTIAPRPASPEPWKQLRDAVLDAVPFEMGAFFYGLLAYAVVQFALLVASFEPASVGTLLTTESGLRLFSSAWLVLYFSVLIACTAARRTRSPRVLR